MLEASCRINRCRFNRVRLYFFSPKNRHLQKNVCGIIHYLQEFLLFIAGFLAVAPAMSFLHNGDVVPA
jgi:hypothetical protein